MASFKAFLASKKDATDDSAGGSRSHWLQSVDAPSQRAPRPAEAKATKAAATPSAPPSTAPPPRKKVPARRAKKYDEIDFEENQPKSMQEYLEWGFVKPPAGLMDVPPETARRRKEIMEREGDGCVASCGCALEPTPFHMFGTVHAEVEADPDDLPLVSVVVPTYPKRHAYHALTLASFRCQKYANLELIVLDTGGARSPAFDADDASRDPRIRYYHDSADDLSLGQKRNRLVELARGDIVCHFDDDNLYGPCYVETLLPHLQHSLADLVAVHGWWNYVADGDFIERVPPDAVSDGKKARGESFFHRRKTSAGQPFAFPDLDLGEDVAARVAAIHSVDDDIGLYFHVEHHANSSFRVIGRVVNLKGPAAKKPAEDLLALLATHRPLLRGL